MEIKVIAFGQIAELTGKPEINVGEINNTNELRHKLVELFPEMDKMHYSIAVNRKTIHENTGLVPGDVVALLPPFSGG